MHTTLKKLCIVLSLCTLSACGKQKAAESDDSAVLVGQMFKINATLEEKADGTFPSSTYEIFPYSYADGNGDGIGDLKGIDEKLSYIKDTGFRAIWMTPVTKGTSYHKYDVEDYKNIDPAFGTLSDMEKLVQDAHDMDVKVIMDMVFNHTSVQHPWFLEAVEYLKSHDAVNTDECPYTDYYNFSKEFHEGYAKLADSSWYYEARFYEGMPDLNLDSMAVRDEIKDILYFWMDKGVDGFRLDAVTSYYTAEDEKNTAFLTWLKDTVDEKHKDFYMVGEAWCEQSRYTKFYASGVSFFDFAYSGNEGIIAETVRGTYTGKQFAKSLCSEQERFEAVSPDAFNAPFYTNHDMARNAGYYVGDDALAKTKFSLGLNLIQQGNAFLYYGEEIGMKGSGKDENKRLPMQWGDGTECRGPLDADSVTMKYENLSKQEKDSASIYTYVKNAMCIRNAFPAISYGALEAVETDSDVGVLNRTYNGETITMYINASSESQSVKKVMEGALQGVLLTTEEEIVEKDGVITLPSYSIAVYAS